MGEGSPLRHRFRVAPVPEVPVGDPPGGVDGPGALRQRGLRLPAVGQVERGPGLTRESDRAVPEKEEGLPRGEALVDRGIGLDEEQLVGLFFVIDNVVSIPVKLGDECIGFKLV